MLGAINPFSFNGANPRGLEQSAAASRPDPQKIFEKLDADKSGSLTAAELEGSRFGGRIDAAFADIDTNGDAALTTEELKAFREENGPPPPSVGRANPGGSGAGIQSLFQNLMETLEASDDEESAYATNVVTAAQALYTEVQGIWAR